MTRRSHFIVNFQSTLFVRKLCLLENRCGRHLLMPISSGSGDPSLKTLAFKIEIDGVQ